MGAWGTGILQNDTTADIWVEFKELYNKGLSPKEIRIKLEKEYKPQNDREYYGEIWTGIAYGQWMCGQLEDYTLRKVKNSTNTKWLALWKDNKKQLAKRIGVLSDFIEKIQSPRSTPLKRKKIVDRPSYFKSGDIIGVKINQNEYLAAIVVAHDDDRTHGENTIVLTTLTFHNNKPSLKEVRRSNVLYLDIGGNYNHYQGYFMAIFSARNMAKKIGDAIKIGTVKIKKYLYLGAGIPIGDWNKIPDLYFEQIEFEKKRKTRMPFIVTINDLLTPKEKLESKLIEWDKQLLREYLEKSRNALKKAE